MVLPVIDFKMSYCPKCPFYMSREIFLLEYIFSLGEEELMFNPISPDGMTNGQCSLWFKSIDCVYTYMAPQVLRHEGINY